MAPEYLIYGKVDEKIDVYAFGVVLLELLSGRKPIRTGCPKGEESLVMWVSVFLTIDKFKFNRSTGIHPHIMMLGKAGP